MIEILIVDDHVIVIEGLKQILSDISDMSVSGEAYSGDEALTIMRGRRFDVVLLDISMPGKNILELIKEIKIRFPMLPILILSMYPEDQYAVRMLRAGADGYLTKDSAAEQLVYAIRKVASGGKYVSIAMTEKLVNELNLKSKESSLPHLQLSDREFQVFISLCKGAKITDIANEMAKSVKTVSTFRTRLMKKMNMTTNAELITYALKKDLIS
ncbi:MAG: response regulator transcription factor [Methylococcaceae bacterium]